MLLLIIQLSLTSSSSILACTVSNLRINKQETSLEENHFVQPCGFMFV
jgi:hypothetical protein